MKFSQRFGFEQHRLEIQIDSADEPLLNGLWNEVSSFLKAAFDHYDLIRLYSEERIRQSYAYDLWVNYHKKSFDKIPYNGDSFYELVRANVFQGEWFEIYNLIDFMLQSFFSDEELKAGFTRDCNKVMEKEMSGWRIVGGQLTQLTSVEEIQSVEDACHLKTKYASATTHIKHALALMSDRKNPDYRNSIKESISSVEAICRIVSNNPKATLGAALATLEKQGFELHPAQKGALEKLYGYTNDESGIRHSLTKESSVGFEDAKFMLVICSAFLNFIQAKA